MSDGDSVLTDEQKQQHKELRELEASGVYKNGQPAHLSEEESTEDTSATPMNTTTTKTTSTK